MPTDLRALFQDAAPTPKDELDFDNLLARAERRRVMRRLRRWVAGLAALGAIGAPVGVALVPAGHPGQEVRTVNPHPEPGLPGPAPSTGTVGPPPSQRSAGVNRVSSSSGSGAAAAGRAQPSDTQQPSGGSRPAPASSPASTNFDWATPSGGYVYTVSGYATHPGDPTTESMSTDTLHVDAPSGSDQHSVRDLEDTSRATYEFAQTVEHRSDGLHLVSFSRIYNSTYVSTCQLSAAPLVLPADPQPGYHLHVTIPNCQYYYSGNLRPADLTVDILRTGSVAVGSASVPAIEVRVEIAFNGGATSSQNEDDVDDEWIRPTDGLVLKEHRTDTFTAGPETTAATDTWGYDSTLTSTTPLR